MSGASGTVDADRGRMGSYCRRGFPAWPAARLLVIALAGILSGCERLVTPAGPTTVASAAAPAPTVALTVRVLVRGSEEPVPHATVFRNNSAVGQTDIGGLLRAEVPLGVEFSIHVSAPGFIGWGASATVTSQERWTFYLERESGD
jgi:hypothetical protein